MNYRKLHKFGSPITTTRVIAPTLQQSIRCRLRMIPDVFAVEVRPKSRRRWRAPERGAQNESFHRETECLSSIPAISDSRDQRDSMTMFGLRRQPHRRRHGHVAQPQRSGTAISGPSHMRRLWEILAGRTSMCGLVQRPVEVIDIVLQAEDAKPRCTPCRKRRSRLRSWSL
jgi:hypothetical protein